MASGEEEDEGTKHEDSSTEEEFDGDVRCDSSDTCGEPGSATDQLTLTTRSVQCAVRNFSGGSVEGGSAPERATQQRGGPAPGSPAALLALLSSKEAVKHANALARERHRQATDLTEAAAYAASRARQSHIKYMARTEKQVGAQTSGSTAKQQSKQQRSTPWRRSGSHTVAVRVRARQSVADPASTSPTTTNQLLPSSPPRRTATGCTFPAKDGDDHSKGPKYADSDHKGGDGADEKLSDSSFEDVNECALNRRARSSSGAPPREMHIGLESLSSFSSRRNSKTVHPAS